MGNINKELRKMRFEQIECMLASDMTCAEWCRLNKVPKSTMYHWLKIFRKTNGVDSKQNGWIELDRKEIKAARALVPTNASASSTSDAAHKDSYTPQPCTQPIRLHINGVEIASLDLGKRRGYGHFVLQPLASIIDIIAANTNTQSKAIVV